MAYGKHVHIGDGFYANFNLVLVDDVDIYIGENVMITPNVTISPTGIERCSLIRMRQESADSRPGRTSMKICRWQVADRNKNGL